MISHSLQEEYFLKNYEEIASLNEKERAFKNYLACRGAFVKLATDPFVAKEYKNWARFFLEPKGIVQLFNELYQRDLNVEITPRIIEEITEEFTEQDETSTDATPLRNLVNQIVRLNPPCLPNLHKIEEYFAKTGKTLPVYVARKQGGKLVSVEFTPDLTRELVDLVAQFRLGNSHLTRQEIFNRAEEKLQEFLDRLPPEQRKEILSWETNLEIRFSTSRDVLQNEAKQMTEPNSQIPSPQLAAA